MEFVVDFSPIVDMKDNSSVEEEQYSTGIDFSSFTKDGGTTFKEENTESRAKKPKRSYSKTVEIIPETIAAKLGPEESEYSKGFNKTTMMLEGAIAQTDQLSAEIKEDIDNIRSSKTLKNKYTYLTNLTNASASLIATKVNAIREMNSSITQAFKLELDKAKSIRDAEKEQNDDSRMMDLYKAFVNTPVGTYSAPAIPNVSELAAGSQAGILATSIGDLPAMQLTPEQVRMRMESNPNIMTVIKFNQSTGQRFFDVIDRTTGQSIPNYPRPDAFLLDNTTIDIHAMSARNKNIDQVWPLVLIGDGDLSEY